MKKLRYLIIIIALLGLIVSGCFSVVPPVEKEDSNNECAIIEDGTIFDVNDNVITTGYDKWGYNYQAHIFNGLYWNYSRPLVPWTKETLEAAEKSTTWLVMKWNDTWLSNKDCNLDGTLDRGYACNPENPTSSACEGAWETNHQRGKYVEDGKTYKWTYFVKIVMVPEGEGAYTDYKDDILYWYTADGIEIGSVIWGAYARILQVYNDQGTGEHGIEYLSPASPGFGNY